MNGWVDVDRPPTIAAPEPTCSACGQRPAVEVTPDDREAFPTLAGWIVYVCKSKCPSGRRLAAARAKAKARAT